MKKLFITRILLFTSLLALCLLSYLFYNRLQALMESYYGVNHATEVTLELEKLIGTLKNAETGHHGYLLTGEPKFLNSYNAGIREYPQHLNRVKFLIADNNAQQKRLQQAEMLAQRCERLMQASLSKENQSNPQLLEGKLAMDDLQEHIANMISVENELRESRNMVLQRRIFFTPLFLLVLTLAALAMLVYSFIQMMRQVNLRYKIQENEEWLRQAVDEQTKELSEKNFFSQSLLNTSQEWIAVWDKDMRIVMVNDACAQMMGVDKNEVIGTSLYDLYPNARGSKSEMDLKRALNGEPIKNDVYFSPLTERWIQNYLTPLNDKNGAVYAALVIAQDVTNIIRSQEELRKSQHHFSQLFQLSPVAKTLSLASDGTVMDVNPAWEKMFGKKREEVIGKNAGVFGMSDSAERARFARLIDEKNGNVHGVELRFDLGGGRYADAYTSVVMIDIDGVRCYLSAYFDITERKAAEEKTAQMTRALEQKNTELRSMVEELASFTYVASHDLQEPLRKIQTFSKRIANEEISSLSDKAKSYFGKIELSAARMQRLIQDLLHYSRTGNVVKKFETVDLQSLVEEVLDSLRETILENNAVVRVESLPKIHAIPYQMQQLFTNIISNSIKFAREGTAPEIHISATMFDGERNNGIAGLQKIKYHCISVKDNGIGFDATFREQIFGLFQRLHGRNEYEGTGIGLAICKKIMENHAGLIQADGEKGSGARFTFYLPVL